ncbi:hypothetical protein VTJ04DRAFT_6164 [Mycothermus thermophilus]|uniref:uncharacterized protein n=1 Tax=Humicola insolens TaxID=85995 RepID=UPI003743885A
MSAAQQLARPLVRSLRNAAATTPTCPHRALVIRQLSSTPSRSDEPSLTTGASEAASAEAQKQAADAVVLGKKPLISDTTTIKKGSEEDLAKLLDPRLGSLRRRAALATTGDIPFEQLPYQAFQEARKLLAKDREEKVAKIMAELEKIKRLEATDPSIFRTGEKYKQKRLRSMRNYVERLKILADINDPMVKRRFEDGMGASDISGDMNKPIYRFLAHRKWCSMDRKIIMQRIEQFFIVPDLLPKFEPNMDVKLHWRRRKIAPGSILDSLVTESPPTLRMQVFDAGERYFTIAVIDADVPDPETDSFKTRLHYLATNIPWSPTHNSLSLSRIGADPAATSSSSSTTTPPQPGNLAVPWLPPHSQKGAPYHRLAIFILQHKDNVRLDEAKLRELYDGAGREGFNLRSFRAKFPVVPVGFNMFRTVWDEHTAEVMARHGIPGADVEFRRPRVHSAKPPRKPRGWEAKRQGPKYRHLWKYTKRIKGLKWTYKME